VPAVETTTELGAAVSRFPAGERGLEVTAAARAAAQEALARSGLLLLGEMHGVREIRIRYGSGAFWNLGPRRFGPPPPGADAIPARLAEEDGELVLDLPVASEATVPQRPLPRHP